MVKAYVCLELNELAARSRILELRGLEAFLDIIRRQESGNLAESSQREHAKVAKEASAGLLALLEDDQTKLEVCPFSSSYDLPVLSLS